MALNNNNGINSNHKRTRIYKLCCTCNLQGKKGNALVICTICTNNIHTSNSCSSKINTSNTANEEEKYICNKCKAKRKSVNAKTPTTYITSRRSNQTSTTTSGRVSNARDTTPTLTSQHSKGRANGSGELFTKLNTQCTTAHQDLQQQIDKLKPTCEATITKNLQMELEKLNNLLQDLQIICSNNSTTINFLKQENTRLHNMIKNQQTCNHYLTSNSNSLYQQSIIDSSSSQSSNYNNNVNFNKYNNHNINHSNNNPFNKNNSNLIFNNNNSCKDNLISNQNSSHEKSNFSSIVLTSDRCNNNSSKINQNNLKSNSDLHNLNFDSDNRVPLTYELEQTSEIGIHGTGLIERRELFVPGFMPINSETNLRCIAFSILKTLIPSLHQSDSSFPTKSLRTDRELSSECSSFIIALKSPEFIKSVMHAKKSFNYFSTKDINKQYLNSEVAIALPDKKILINEVLTSIERTQFKIIKDTAKKLGFQFVWYNL